MSESTRAQRDTAVKRRARLDRLTTQIVAGGGIAVMLLVAGIFSYLLSVALPLFTPASISAPTALEKPSGKPEAPVLFDLDESGEIAYRLVPNGVLTFIDVDSGLPIATRQLEIGAGIHRVHRPDPGRTLYALESADGHLHFLELTFPVSFATGTRERQIRVEPPFRDSVIDLQQWAPAGVKDLAVHLEEATLSVAILDGRDSLQILRYADAEAGLPLLPPERHWLSADGLTPVRLFLGSLQWLFVLHADGRTDAWDVRFPEDARRLASRALAPADVDAVTLLLGGGALLVPQGRGPDVSVAHWFPTRLDGGGFQWVRVRDFPIGKQIASLIPETRRRGFLVLAVDGDISIHHTTAATTLTVARPLSAAPNAFALSARGDELILEDANGGLQRIAIDNEHPEVSRSALLDRVWYEGYPAPQYTWQSTSASTDFEPKFSLAPLIVGTLKAAFYSMLFAIPVAALGAIYCAYFMAPGLRAWIKPSVELMAALPTVILGFLAGLWLAPIIERALPSVLLFAVLAPVLCVTLGAFIQLLPRTRLRVLPDGWQALAMIPVLLFAASLANAYGPSLEHAFMGDIRAWLRTQLAIDYDQRNAIVVGIAMGVAVIPVIFAIAEDAISSVPARLSHGALALGATRWQALFLVILPTASPGIFSALMIGFGRAVGETMIVLMASGNTPILDWDPFTGMRTFAANLAIELPESVVGSSHYRVLFLSALVLFAFTFLVNTIGEAVRQRLRERYGEL